MGMTGRQWWGGVTDITNVSHSGVGWRSSVASPCSAIGRQDSPVHMHRVRMMDNGHKVLCVIYCTERQKSQGLKACSRTFCEQTVHVFIEYVPHILNYNTLRDLFVKTLTARELNVTVSHKNYFWANSRAAPDNNDEFGVRKKTCMMPLLINKKPD